MNWIVLFRVVVVAVAATVGCSHTVRERAVESTLVSGTAAIWMLSLLLLRDRQYLLICCYVVISTRFSRSSWFILWILHFGSVQCWWCPRTVDCCLCHFFPLLDCSWYAFNRPWNTTTANTNKYIFFFSICCCGCCFCFLQFHKATATPAKRRQRTK